MSTQIQAEVSDALDELGFERQPSKQMGSPTQFKVPANALDKLREKMIIVNPDGHIEIQPAKSA